jgi:hypothetical protein
VRDQAYRNAEQAIERVRIYGEQALSLTGSYKTGSSKLTELPESLSTLRQLVSLNLSRNRLKTFPEWLGQLTQLQSLDLCNNEFTALPESLGQLSQLRSLDLSNNELTALPDSLSQLSKLESLNLQNNLVTTLPEEFGELIKLQSLNLFNLYLLSVPNSFGDLAQLQWLNLSHNVLAALPESFGRLARLQSLNLAHNKLTALPESLGQLAQLKSLDLSHNELTALPNSLGQMRSVTTLVVASNPLNNLPASFERLTSIEAVDCTGCQFTDLPASFAELPHLRRIDLKNNPLNPELAALYKEGRDAVRRYLRAKADAQVELNEAKLILIGEGEVGKSCLLGALRDDPWEEGKPTTHGIEIKQVKITDPVTGSTVTLNGWDFGGQRVYRPTHQLFFSAPAIYLVVWKPREGPQQGFVEEWITLVKHRAPDAKIIVVATHGGAKQRQPDIDRQEIWDHFGKDMVVDFILVDSKPNVGNGRRRGIAELKQAIVHVAASLPGMGRKVAKRWEETRQALKGTGAAYLPFERVMKLCHDHRMDEDEAKDFVRSCHRLGHLIHYEHDPLLQDIVVLKPDWLSTAISFVLDDERTRKAHGLVSSTRLDQLWDDPKRPNHRYPTSLHPIFLRLMERYDLSYRIAERPKDRSDETSLIAQLVPDVRPPEQEINVVWPAVLTRGDEQQIQICRIVDAKTGNPAMAEGLFFQLIVRLHKFSLGRENHDGSVHWQRGLVLDDDYNGRALLENVGSDVRIAVRAPYPEQFLSVLTHEVKWLVENFWKGLRCEVMVPCGVPCGRDVPGTGLFQVEKLINFKKQGMQQFPCIVSGCSQLQEIDALLRNAPAVRRTSIELLLKQGLDQMRSSLDRVRFQLTEQDRDARDRFRTLDQNDRRIMSQVEDAYTGLMQALTDEAKEGPRLFSFEPVDRRIFDRPKWLSAKFRLTLWCEHCRLPLPAINGKGDTHGVYELDIPREWVVKAMPYLRLVTGLLSLVVPVASSAAKLELDDATYKGIENQLEFGQKGLESALKGGEKAEDWASKRDAPNVERGNTIQAKGAVLRQLHAWLKEKDPSFGALVRVQNRRQEFLWVHSRFESEY